MGHEFFTRVRKTSFFSGAFIALAVAVYYSASAGMGWLIGCAWSLVNLYFIGLLVDTLLSRGPSRRRRATLIAIVKVPGLYAIGTVILAGGWFPLIALLAGFMWPLFVISLKILGRAVLGLDKPRRVIGADPDLVAKRIQH